MTNPLVVVDAQAGLGPLATAPRNNPGAEQVIGWLLERWRKVGEPVLHVVHDSVEPDSLIKLSLPGGEFHPSCRPESDEPVIIKHVNSGFIGTDLEARLHQLEADTVTFAGLTTNHCVSTTVRMAGNLGFTTWLAADGTAAFDHDSYDGTAWPAQTVHEVALASLHREFTTVAPAHSIAEELWGRELPVRPDGRLAAGPPALGGPATGRPATGRPTGCGTAGSGTAAPPGDPAPEHVRSPRRAES